MKKFTSLGTEEPQAGNFETRALASTEKRSKRLVGRSVRY